MTMPSVALSVAPAPVVVRPRRLERLEAEIVELAGQLTAASARLLAMIGEFDAEEGWRDWGMRSTAHWLSWKCGVGLHAGREQVRVARALRGLPVMTVAFGAGRLSYSKVRALTRFAAADTEADLVMIAEYATASQIDRLAADHRRAVTADDVRARRAREFLHYRYDDDGSLILTARIAPERAAVVLHALDVAGACRADTGGDIPAGTLTDSAATDRESTDRETAAARRRVDALVAIAERSLESVPAGTPADLHQLVVHTTATVLATGDEADDTGDPAALVTPGGVSVRVHPSTARRLSCDCPTSTMLDGPDGGVLHAGRKTRRVHGRLRRAVHARDRGRCRAPGCTAKATQIHHLRHWANGGSTCLTNLISLCDQHHWLVHEGGWTLATRSPGQWGLLGPTGIRLGPHPEPAVVTAPMPHDPSIPADIATGRWQGDRMNTSYILAGFIGAPIPPRKTSPATVVAVETDTDDEEDEDDGYRLADVIASIRRPDSRTHACDLAATTVTER